MINNYLKLILFMIFFNLFVNGKIPKKLEGGRLEFINNHPSTVSIYYIDHHLCTGNIIDEYHILTAASCITSGNNVVYGNLQVYSGINQLNFNNINSISNEVELVIYHNYYKPENLFVNDIAILRLTNKLIFDRTRRALFMRSLNRLSKYYSGNVIGWGKLPIYYVQQLKKIAIKLISRNNCFNRINLFLHASQECFYPTSDSSRISQGDGGSHVNSGGGNFNELFGIVSLTTDIAVKQITIYTSIYQYYDWINEMKLQY